MADRPGAEGLKFRGPKKNEASSGASVSRKDSEASTQGETPKKRSDNHNFSADDSSAELLDLPLVAPINWAQTATRIYISYMVGAVTDIKVELGGNGQSLTFSARDDTSRGNASPQRYSTTIDMFDQVLPMPKTVLPRACRNFVRVEFEKVMYQEWDRLSAVPHRMVRNLVTYDWELHATLDSDDEPSSDSEDDEGPAAGEGGGADEADELLSQRSGNSSQASRTSSKILSRKASSSAPAAIGDAESKTAQENTELRAMIDGYKKDGARKRLLAEKKSRLIKQVVTVVSALLFACLLTLFILWRVYGW